MLRVRHAFADPGRNPVVVIIHKVDVPKVKKTEALLNNNNNTSKTILGTTEKEEKKRRSNIKKEKSSG